MESRDVISCYGVNSRFDNLHAIVGNVVFETLDDTIDKRISHAARFDKALTSDRFQKFIQVPERNPSVKNVVHLYIIRVERRDELLEYLKSNGVEAKVHYPIPLHLQPAAKIFGYKEGMFPVTEGLSKNIVTLPCHQYLSEEQIDYTIHKVADFYEV